MSKDLVARDVTTYVAVSDVAHTIKPNHDKHVNVEMITHTSYQGGFYILNSLGN